MKRLKSRFNKLNWLVSYITKSKTVLKPPTKPSDKQPIISIIKPVVFLFAQKNIFLYQNRLDKLCARDQERSYKDSKHPRLNPKQRTTHLRASSWI